MDLERLRGYVGLAVRAGQLTCGSEPVCRMIRENKAKIVLIDSGASENTLKRVTDACRYRSVRFQLLEAGWLSTACGKPNLMTAALPAGGLCEAVIKTIQS